MSVCLVRMQVCVCFTCASVRVCVVHVQGCVCVCFCVCHTCASLSMCVCCTCVYVYAINCLIRNIMTAPILANSITS